jgi:hypothetical protein
MEAVNTIGILQYPDTYLTIRATGPHTITIYDTAHNAAFSQAILGVDGIAAYKISEHRVARGYADLEALTMKLAHDNDDRTLAALGVNASGWGPDFDHDNVSMTLARAAGTRPAALPAGKLTATANALAAHYGAGLISVNPVPEVAPTRQGGGVGARDSDQAPLNGGNGYVNNIGLNACSSAFTAKDPTTNIYYILTAGHCGNAGDSTTLGTAFVKSYYSGGWDFATMKYSDGSSGTTSPNVWYGSDGTNLAYTVRGEEVPVVGLSSVTEDGDSSSAGGERPGNLVKAYGICKSISGYSTCNLGYDQSSNGSPICWEGDSGGPVYGRTSPLGGAYAVGIHVGGASSTGTQGPNGASDMCYFQDIAPVLHDAGNLVLMTSPALQQIKTVVSGLNFCADIYHDSLATIPAVVDIYTCNGGPNQQWTVEPSNGDLAGTIESLGLCLEAAGLTSGSLVYASTCSSPIYSAWSYNSSTKALVNTSSGLCLDDPKFSTTLGTQLDVWTCNGGANQKWTLPS